MSAPLLRKDSRDSELANVLSVENDSMPVKAVHRTWDKTSFVFFWITDSFNINTIQLASTGLLNGKLSVFEVICSILLGYAIVGFFIHLSARIGVYNHVPFAVASQMSFGRRGSIWPVLNRVFVGAVWYSVQCWIGGQCIQLVIKSVFYGVFDDDEGNNHGNWGDHFSFEMVGFAIFCVLTFFVILIPPHRLRPVLALKAYVVPVAALGLLGWSLVRASSSEAAVKPKAHSNEHLKLWTFVTSTMNCVSNFATLIINASDFSRYAKSPKSVEWVNVISIPVCFTLTSMIGIFISSASRRIYGVSYWSPLDVLDRFLSDAKEYSFFWQVATRIGVVVITLSFVIAQVGTNVANSVSAATGLSCLYPKYVNMKRGGIICALFSLVIRPWTFFESSSNFTVYLSAYSVFLSGMAGVMLTDYYIVRNGYVFLPDLYRKQGLYSFRESGVWQANWRAYAGYVVGIIPNFPGFLKACGKLEGSDSKFWSAAGMAYEFNFFVGFGTASIVYILLCYKWPVPGESFGKEWKEEWKEVEHFGEELWE